MKILVVNGPNMGLLGRREPAIYGRETLSGVETRLRKIAEAADCELEFLQSNHEGIIVDRLNAILAGNPVDGVIINSAAYSHTSLAIADALRALSCPKIEVHVSNIFARENFRHESLTAPACSGVIAGLGTAGYDLALTALIDILRS